MLMEGSENLIYSVQSSDQWQFLFDYIVVIRVPYKRVPFCTSSLTISLSGKVLVRVIIYLVTFDSVILKSI